MPKVGKKEFPYTKAGMKAAAAEKKKMMAKKKYKNYVLGYKNYKLKIQT